MEYHAHKQVVYRQTGRGFMVETWQRGLKHSSERFIGSEIGLLVAARDRQIAIANVSPAAAKSMVPGLLVGENAPETILTPGTACPEPDFYRFLWADGSSDGYPFPVWAVVETF